MKKGDKHKYIIPFVGLSIGKHQFEYDVDTAFFEKMEYSPIQSGAINVSLELEKKETMLIANFRGEGEVGKACDRCDGMMKIPVKGELEIIYKFGYEASDDENLIVLSPEAYEIDVTEPIYQMIIISIPSRNVHEEGECDEEMLSLLRKYTVNDNEDDAESEDDDDDDEDSVWSILKNKN